MRKSPEVTRRRFVSPAGAARRLGLHRNTVYEWAMAAMRGEGDKIKEVERHPITGYIKIPLSEIDRIKKEAEDNE